MEVILICIASLLFIWLLVDEADRVKRRREKKGREFVISRVKEIHELNPGLEFNFTSLPVFLRPDQKRRISEKLGWPMDYMYSLRDVLALLPEKITPGPELRREFEDQEKAYQLIFDSHLRPEYALWGWEGKDDSLPYSELGDDDWFNDPEYGGWKHTRTKTPEDVGECYVQMIEFLVDNNLIKLEKDSDGKEGKDERENSKE